MQSSSISTYTFTSIFNAKEYVEDVYTNLYLIICINQKYLTMFWDSFDNT